MASFSKDTFNKKKSIDGDFKNHLQSEKTTAKQLKKFKRFKEQKLMQLRYTIAKLGANL